MSLRKLWGLGLRAFSMPKAASFAYFVSHVECYPLNKRLKYNLNMSQKQSQNTFKNNVKNKYISMRKFRFFSV